MNWEKIALPALEETVYKGVHASGLTLYVCPKTAYTSAYAIIGTQYGSIDTTFAVDGKEITVPAGIAHYLEHKLFENEDCDAFEKYAKTGASANAFTGFQQTAYLFSCTEKVEENLKILLDFVQNPYFTDENVEKERGIIGQEIRMCEDDPERAAMFHLLEMLYSEHPVRVDIAGTVQSIAAITPQLLYDCYGAFYNLHNMALVVTGAVDCETVERAADASLRPAPPYTLRRQACAEPDTVTEKRREQHMPVAVPLFYIGIKEPVEAGCLHTPAQLAAAEILLELLAGRGSELYAQLMEQGLINETFGSGYFEGSGYAAFLFSGESKNPDAVMRALKDRIQTMQQQGIDLQRFEEERNAMYGRLLMGLNDVESCGDWLLDDHFYGRKPFGLIDSVASLDVKSVYTVLNEKISTARMALSVVSPADSK